MNKFHKVRLLALGFEKDHQWARRMLSEFEGVFWEVKAEKNKKLYSWISHHNHHFHHNPQNGEIESNDGGRE